MRGVEGPRRQSDLGVLRGVVAAPAAVHMDVHETGYQPARDPLRFGIGRPA